MRSAFMDADRIQLIAAIYDKFPYFPERQPNRDDHDFAILRRERLTTEENARLMVLHAEKDKPYPQHRLTEQEQREWLRPQRERTRLKRKVLNVPEMRGSEMTNPDRAVHFIQSVNTGYMLTLAEGNVEWPVDMPVEDLLAWLIKQYAFVRFRIPLRETMEEAGVELSTFDGELLRDVYYYGMNRFREGALKFGIDPLIAGGETKEDLAKLSNFTGVWHPLGGKHLEALKEGIAALGNCCAGPVRTCDDLPLKNGEE